MGKDWSIYEYDIVSIEDVNGSYLTYMQVRASILQQRQPYLTVYIQDIRVLWGRGMKQESKVFDVDKGVR